MRGACSMLEWSAHWRDRFSFGCVVGVDSRARLAGAGTGLASRKFVVFVNCFSGRFAWTWLTISG